MPLKRSKRGKWRLVIETDEEKERVENSHASLREAIPRYFNCLDPAFELARKRSECDFIFALLRVRGIMPAGWDPFETTAKAIPSLIQVMEGIEALETRLHLSLWIYGHIVEASEPYEVMANLINIAKGGRY